MFGTVELDGGRPEREGGYRRVAEGGVSAP
jgi:hypothetical protein